MDYLQFYYEECLFHTCDVMANGVCTHPDVNMPMDHHCRACFRFKLRESKK
jgi:hypothetical protein